MNNKRNGANVQDPYANQNNNAKHGGRANQEDSFDNESQDDEDMSMDASTFINRRCNFADESMLSGPPELTQSQSQQPTIINNGGQPSSQNGVVVQNNSRATSNQGAQN